MCIRDSTCQMETFCMGENADLRAVNVQRIHQPGYLGVQYDLDGLEHYTCLLYTSMPPKNLKRHKMF